ncbi:metal-dependent phosphohydrolase [Sulfitobacter aestuariivivens]|uniref:Metal-dependent phosphohydrolase n=1 Tax=Sulfitobacter aestuariivivens TaxID=2766981 RepID=A0A927D144_9RHOB|nr:metal-dependent phosphohydrolase [Sulfitobacter aestuariivivens]MBD3662496.1 metal-dependent phosphohydrolase [Sulfitobacter aestuariivivens]
MFNPTAVVATEFGDHLAETYLQYFSGRKAEYAAFISGSARMILERLGNSDALYHNAEHTMMVTLVGQQIIRGQLVTRAVQPEDWLHFIVSLLVHDIGYSRNICEGDSDTEVVINEAGDKICPPRGASDAFLAPYHIERGKIYARQRFEGSGLIDEERIADAIEYTRFPVPDDKAYAQTTTEAALVRAADLIGQIADPFYHRKITALYYEFDETGFAEKLGYETPMDLMEQFPQFFWRQVQPLIGPALTHLEQTMEGKQWVAQLYNHVFQASHRASCLGPFPGAVDTK